MRNWIDFRQDSHLQRLSGRQEARKNTVILPMDLKAWLEALPVTAANDKMRREQL
jgi:hypothetical protein